MSMTVEARQEVEKLLRAGERNRAIQYLNNTFNISLQDSELLVAALEQQLSLNAESIASTQSTQETTLGGNLKAEVSDLLQKGRKLDAVKSVRQQLHVGLKEALTMVEEVAREMNPNYVAFNPAGCLRTVAKAIGIFLMVVALMFLSGAAIAYFFQDQSIKKSDLVQGEITEMKYLETGESAPVITYDWNGKTQSYESNYYTSPPDFKPGQAVSLYINREEPGEVIINSFSDRYAVIVGLGIIGGVLLAVSIVFIYFARRKF
jgi:ribosomal protein L7/L12